jgi:hypothetical protein
MLYLTIKAALSGVIIAIVSEVAKRYLGFGALIASLPSSRDGGFGRARRGSKLHGSKIEPPGPSFGLACGTASGGADSDQGEVRGSNWIQDAMANARNSAEAANMTAVAAQPSTIMRFETDRSPIARGLRTISIITAIRGAARIPLTTAAQ